MGEDTDNKILQATYYDAKTGFGSAVDLYRKVRLHNITMKRVKEFLSKQETHQKFKKPKARKAEMFKIEAERGTWQVDFVYMKHRKINNGFHKIFCAVEIGSRLCYVQATKDLKKLATEHCFDNLLKFANDQGVGLKYVVSDKGSEFVSHNLKSWFENHGIKHRMVHPTYHYLANSLVERFNRTLKDKMMRYLSAYKTKKWVDHLPDIMENYNNSQHAYHKEKPKEVAQNPAKQLINRLKAINYNERLKADKNSVLHQMVAGATVRIRKRKDEPFGKASNTFSKKVHTVVGKEKMGTMIRVEGKSRLLRAWEVGHVKEVETNPFNREIRSGDVENALKKGRESRSKRAKGRSNTEQTEVVRGKNKVRVIPEKVEHKSAPTAPKKQLNRLKIAPVTSDEQETIDYVNGNILLVVKTDHEDKFWLAHRVSRVRRAVLEDEKRSGKSVLRGEQIVTIKWYENSVAIDRDSNLPSTYTLPTKNNYLSVSSVNQLERSVAFESVDKKNSVYVLSADTRHRIISDI